MQPLAVVKHFDVLGHGHARPGSGCENLWLVHLVFQACKKRLGHGIVPAHAGAAHRLSDAVISAVLTKLLRGILRSVIRINPNSG